MKPFDRDLFYHCNFVNNLFIINRILALFVCKPCYSLFHLHFFVVSIVQTLRHACNLCAEKMHTLYTIQVIINQNVPAYELK